MTDPKPLVLNEYDANQHMGTRLHCRNSPGGPSAPDTVCLSTEVDGRWGSAHIGVRDARRLAQWFIEWLGLRLDGGNRSAKQDDLSPDQKAGLAGHRTATGLPGMPMQREDELAQPGEHEPEGSKDRSPGET
jgi:hypothetical protein